jgi:predicted membrane channel-forming protein YqfA (hemolysin III family)
MFTVFNSYCDHVAIRGLVSASVSLHLEDSLRGRWLKDTFYHLLGWLSLFSLTRMWRSSMPLAGRYTTG